MNKTYRVIWSQVKHGYVVASELAKNHAKNGGHAAHKQSMALLCAVFLCSGYGMVMAVDNAAGQGKGVAVGTGSSAPNAENVAVGEDAKILYSNGLSAATGDVAIGSGAKINNYASQGGSIAIGKNAQIENMAGGGEASFAFGQTKFKGSGFLGLQSPFIPADPARVVGSVAIGDNTFARTGSTMIGSHNYNGELGDTNVDSASTRASAISVYATTIGANSFSNGAFTTSTGVYNIMSSDYKGGRLTSVKNLGATINGSLNSIESMTGSSYSGIANTISGIANRTFNSNGTLIYGAGNEITNSITGLTGVPKNSGNSAKDFADKLRTAIADSESGGATFAIGGGNKADYTQKTSIIGVNNKVNGTEDAVSIYNFISGYKNTATNVQHVSVIGSENTVTDTKGSLVLGDKRTVSQADGSIILGSSEKGTTTGAKNAVAIGSEANVTKDGGVALGAHSIASVDKGVAGYDPTTGKASEKGDSIWKATDAAVSVGDGTTVTRQITGVAAGWEDTDAVNAAQLKKAVSSAADGNDVLDKTSQGLTLAGNTLSLSVKDTAGNEVKGSVDLSAFAGTDTRNTIMESDTVAVDDTNKNADGSINYKLNVKTDGKVEKDNQGVVNGGTVYKETRIEKDGTYIKKINTAGENLTILDKQVGVNTTNITNLGNRVGELGTRVNKVGAGAAALAALHPMDFDPDDKWDFAVGYGNYKDAHAAAVGAYYRPNEDTMFSVGGSFGGGENMVNAGVSWKFGQRNQISRSRVSMAKDMLAMKHQIEMLTKKLEAYETGKPAGRVTASAGSVMFPDVPENHWAYEYVKLLTERGYLTGYPDGEFKGDRAMTRYEYAAIIYRALQNGAPSDGAMVRSVDEFGSELVKVQNIDRFRVDRISGKDNDRNKAERVRINDKDNAEKNDYRDVYGSHITK